MKTIYKLFELFFVICLFVGGCMAFARGVDKHLRNQDEMLCNSARFSKNLKWVVKCQCFYSGEDIDCIYDEN